MEFHSSHLGNYLYNYTYVTQKEARSLQMAGAGRAIMSTGGGRSEYNNVVFSFPKDQETLVV